MLKIPFTQIYHAFKKDWHGNITGEVYKKIRAKIFSPQNTDQPLRFVMSFLLNEYAKALSQQKSTVINFFAMVGGLFGASSAKNDFIELGDFIRQGMKINDFEIICGRDKLEKISVEELSAIMDKVLQNFNKETIIKATKQYSRGTYNAIYNNKTLRRLFVKVCYVTRAITRYSFQKCRQIYNSKTLRSFFAKVRGKFKKY